jgi:hypothetical protein
MMAVTPMTICIHQTQHTVETSIKPVSRNHRSVPNCMDRRFLADIGLIQIDLIVLRAR